jgi:pilus assembly protein FimV
MHYMAVLRLALAQYDFPVGAVAANTAKVREVMTRAREGGASLAVFPELTISGYPPEDLLLRPSFLAACEEAIQSLAGDTNGLAAIVGFPHSLGEVYNAAAFLRGGQIAQVTHKQILPNYGVFDDKRYFRPGRGSAVAVVDGVRVGCLVCEDVWQAEPAAAAAAAGAVVAAIIAAVITMQVRDTTPGAAPAHAPVTKTVRPPAPAAAEPGFVDSLLDNPLLLPGVGVLLALVAGVGIYRLRGRMRKSATETSFLESRLQPDSFFGGSGGQRVDTNQSGSAAGTMSSMSYSLSQLDAIGDVDPVAEADVYLAYGRDLQAEEILKEAMRSTPERMAIRIKLLEVYAKRRDTKAFELLATQVYTLARGEGDDWAKAQELGRSIDPENPLYQPGGRPELQPDDAGRVVAPLDATTLPHTATATAPAFVPAADATLSGAVDVDLELGAQPPAEHRAPSPAEQTRPFDAAVSMSSDSLLDLDIGGPTHPGPSTTPGMLEVKAPAAPTTEFGAIDFDLGELPAATAPAPVPAGAERTDAGLDFAEFPLAGAEPTLPPDDAGDPLARKLELAEEFRQIGDLEGARDLLEEVVAKADGALKTKAEGMLATLG